MNGSASGSQTPSTSTAQETSSTNIAPNGDIEVVNVLQNKLAAAGHDLGISLPQIVVVGSQSAGKTGVLEAIVGCEFLPRGSGTVTRRPTIVQLEKSQNEYAVFLHKPKDKITDFKLIKNEIEKETLKNPGPKGFTSEPISLKIYTPNALKLTLVDLPGLIRVNEKVVDQPGLIRVNEKDQSQDTVQQIREMVLFYIQQPNSLILAVSPANNDLADSGALEIAEMADPLGRRTIGVITKLDLMDEGTNAVPILENKQFPLRRGYIGVVNRSQKDIEDKVDFNYSLQKEKKFLQSKQCYRHLLDKMGTSYLKTFLHQQLREHIRKCLPNVRSQLLKKLVQLQKDLKKCEHNFGCKSTETDIQNYLNKIVQKFIDRFHVEIYGYSENVRSDALSSGVLINYKLYSCIKKTLKLPEIPDEDELQRILCNVHGFRGGVSLNPLFLEKVFLTVMSRCIDPLNEMVDSIGDILHSSIQQSARQIAPYPKLHSGIILHTSKYVNEAVLQTKETLEKHMQAEMYFVNTFHEDFSFPEAEEESFIPVQLWEDSEDGDTDAVSHHSSQESITERNECLRETIEDEATTVLSKSRSAKKNVRYLGDTIKKYLKIQKKHIGDVAVKYIAYFLVKNVMDFVKGELSSTLFNSTEKEAMLKDCEVDINKIKEMKAKLEILEDVLNDVQAFK